MRFKNIKLLFPVIFLAAGFGCADIDSPKILDTTILEDTLDTLGPYEVITSVSDDREVREVSLYFGKGDDETPEAELARRIMEETTDGAYRAEIPGYPAGTNVIYFVTATDLEGNKDRDPKSGYYTFKVLSNP